MVSFFTVLCSLTTFSTILKSSEICRQMQFYHLEYFVYFTFRRKSFRRNNFYLIISFDFQISSLPKIQKPTKNCKKCSVQRVFLHPNINNLIENKYSFRLCNKKNPPLPILRKTNHPVQLDPPTLDLNRLQKNQQPRAKKRREPQEATARIKLQIPRANQSIQLSLQLPETQ